MSAQKISFQLNGGYLSGTKSAFDIPNTDKYYYLSFSQMFIPIGLGINYFATKKISFNLSGNYSIGSAISKTISNVNQEYNSNLIQGLVGVKYLIYKKLKSRI